MTEAEGMAGTIEETERRSLGQQLRSLPTYGPAGLAFFAAAGGIVLAQPDRTAPLQNGPLIAVTTLALLGVFCLLTQAHGPAYLAALNWITPILPAFAAIGTVAAYLSGLAQSGPSAVFIGIVGMFVAWFGLGAAGMDKTRVGTAQERAYSELHVRIQQLSARLDTIRPNPTTAPAFAETKRTLESAMLSLFEAPPGAQWASAIGYVSLWRTVHRTEEALIDVDSVTAVVAGALIDDLRLDGSTIPGRDRLRPFLREAVAELDSIAATKYLTVQGAVPMAPGKRTNVENFRARAMLREVHRAINEYRDARMEDIVRTRNILRRTFGFAAVVSFALLAVAVGIETPKALIATGTGLFLLAALVGLFSRLRNSSIAQSTVDDFGLYEAQLLAGPLVSGIAGIGGVVLIAAAPVAAAALSSVNGTAGAGVAVPMLNFNNIFDLAINPLAVVFAAIFGLTPDLLLTRLQQETDRLKKEIRSSYVADKASETPKETPD